MAAGPLGWPHLPVLAHRLVVLRAAMGDMQQFTVNKANLAFSEAVEAALGTQAGPQLPSQGATPRLEEYFQRAEAALEAGTPHRSAPPVSHPFRAQLTAMRTAPLCHSCSRMPCKGTASSLADDTSNLSNGGHCISALRAIFDEALRIAGLSYGAGPVARVSLRIEGLFDRPQTVLDLAFKASTSEPVARRRGVFSREVLLKVHADSFHFRDYFSMLYVLFHEVFCHGLCGISLTEDSEGEAFSEGWMDWVAAKTLAGVLERGEAPPHLLPYAREMKIKSDDVHERRYAAQDEKPCLGDLYATGRLAAERLQSLLIGRLGSNKEGWEATKRFTVAFNASKASDALRGDLVHACNGLIRGWTPADAFAQAPGTLLALLDGYLAGAIDPFDFSMKLTAL